MTAKQKDVILGLFVVLAFSFVYIYVIPREVPVLSPVTVEALSPDFWPKNITLGIIFLGVFQIVYALARTYPQREPKTQPSAGQSKTALMIGLFLAYCIAIPFLGILLSSVLGMIACMLIFGERRPWVLTLYAVIVPLGIHMFLLKVANLIIPKGILPF